jgi:hypothetical protein
MRGNDGVFRGNILCSARSRTELETVAGLIWFEEQNPCFNPWGCPNLDCCATALVATGETQYDEFVIPATIACTSVGGFTGITMQFGGSGSMASWTTTATQFGCIDQSIPNPSVTTGQEPADLVFNVYVPLAFGLPLECLPTNSFDAYNMDSTVVKTGTQASELICFREIPVSPYFELTGSCISVDGIPTNCGEIVTTQREVRVVTFG